MGAKPLQTIILSCRRILWGGGGGPLIGGGTQNPNLPLLLPLCPAFTFLSYFYFKLRKICIVIFPFTRHEYCKSGIPPFSFAPPVPLPPSILPGSPNPFHPLIIDYFTVVNCIDKIVIHRIYIYWRRLSKIS